MFIFLSKELIEFESFSKTFVFSLSTSNFNQSKQIFFHTNTFTSINSRSILKTTMINQNELFIQQNEVIEKNQIETNTKEVQTKINIIETNIEEKQMNVNDVENFSQKKKRKLTLKNLDLKKKNN